MTRLPKLLQEIADVAGLDAALAIARAKGGTRASFPHRAGPGHWLVATVGRADADKLCRYFGSLSAGVLLAIPLGPLRYPGPGFGGEEGGQDRARHPVRTRSRAQQGRKSFYAQARRRASEMRGEGASIATVARVLGVSMRSVEKWTAAAKVKGLRRKAPLLKPKGRP